MAKCNDYSKHLSSYHSLWRHKKICKGAKPNSTPRDRSPIRAQIRRIIQGYNEPERKEVPKTINPKTVNPKSPKLKVNQSPKIKGNQSTKTAEPKSPTITISPQVLHEIIRPKSLIEIAVERKEIPDSESEEEECISSSSQSETEESSSSQEEEESSSQELEGETEYKFMPKSRKHLMKAFRGLYSKFHDDIDVYSNLVLMLDELKRRECIAEDEYKALNEVLQQKVGLGLEETVHTTTDEMTKNDKEQVLTLLKGMNKDEYVVKVKDLIQRYFDGENVFEDVLEALPTLKEKLDAVRLEIIVKQIQKTTYRIMQVLSRLSGATDKNEVLRGLRQDGLITGDEFDKLLMAPNSVSSFSKILQGRGMYLSKDH
jgi:hypothetical protein